MTATRAEANAMRADRAELILEALRQRAPAEADVQASAMVMAGLKMLQQVRGTPAVLDALSRLGVALVEECPAAPAAPDLPAVTPFSHAEQLFVALTAQPEADGRTRADAMMTAATALLIDRDGVESTVASLGDLAERVRAAKVQPAAVQPEVTQTADLVGPMLAHLRGLPQGDALDRANAAMEASGRFIAETFGAMLPAPAAEPAPAVAPAPASPRPADPIEAALGYLRGLPVEVAKAEAEIGLTAASTFLREVGGAPAIMGPTSGVGTPRPTSDHLACAVVDQLKTAPRWDGHERARSILAGSAAYLHEVFGRSYASAVIAGALDAAAAYGHEVRGGRDSLDTLH